MEDFSSLTLAISLTVGEQLLDPLVLKSWDMVSEFTGQFFNFTPQFLQRIRIDCKIIEVCISSINALRAHFSVARCEGHVTYLQRVGTAGT